MYVEAIFLNRGLHWDMLPCFAHNTCFADIFPKYMFHFWELILVN